MDMYDLLMADEPSAESRAKALGQALGIKEQAGLLGQISGDRVLSGVGGSLMQGAQAGNQRLGDVLRQRQAKAAAQAAAAQEAAQFQARQGLEREKMAADQSFRQRELGVRQAQLDQDLWSAQADPVSGGVVMYNKKTGEVRPLGPGGGTPRPDAGTDGAGPLPGLPGKPTEKQRNEVLGASSAIAQLDLATKALDASPTAYGGAGNVAAGVVENIGGETAQSLLRRRYSPGEQRAKNIIDNVVSGIINERAGANVSLQELLRQSFLPKPTDSYEQARQKLQDLRDMLAVQYDAKGGGMVPDPGTQAGATNVAPAPRKIVGGKEYEKRADGWYEVE